MTMPVPIKTVALPEPGYPMLTRMITDALFPETQEQVVGCPHCKGSITVSKNAGKEDPLVWIVGQTHPIAPNRTVMRMFIGTVGVEVYSVSSDGKATRNLVPMDSVRLTEEEMPMEVFIEEMTDAELDDEDEPDPDPEPAPAPGSLPQPQPAS